MKPTIQSSSIVMIMVVWQGGCFHNTALSYDGADNTLQPQTDAQQETVVIPGPEVGQEAEPGPDMPPDSTPQKRIALNAAGGLDQLLTVDGNMGGLAGADRACQAGADYERLGGTWRAWLSDSNTNAIDRIADVGPWYTMDGHLAFRDKAQLAGTPAAVIQVDQAGSVVAASSYWTGTHPGGKKAGDNCEDWTSDSSTVTGAVGSGRDLTGGWTELKHPESCLTGLNLLCIEQ